MQNDSARVVVNPVLCSARQHAVPVPVLRFHRAVQTQTGWYLVLRFHKVAQTHTGWYLVLRFHRMAQTHTGWYLVLVMRHANNMQLMKKLRQQMRMKFQRI